METLLRWIHISDIHMGHGGVPGQWDQELVLQQLLRDVGRQPKDPPVDLVFVTGDVAQMGGASKRFDEYGKATAWLSQVAAAVGVPRDRVFVVPGNHDVDRGVDTADPAVGALVADLRAGKIELDAALADPALRAMLARRMEKYAAFSRGFADPGGDGLFWSRSFKAKSGLPVRLVGLNTSLLAADNFDHGKLRVGLGQLAEALRGVTDEELVIALGHHPATGGWLADEARIAGHLKGSVHALLTGHVHLSDAEQTRSGGGTTFLRVVAGSAHGDAMPEGIPAGHGYNFGAVVRTDRGGAAVRIWPRRWVEKDGEFRVDKDSTPDRADFSEHPLPARLALPAAKSAPVTPGGPIPIFISSVSADSLHREELEKRLSGLRRPILRATVTGSHAVPPGEETRAWIAAQIERAQIILLLLSPDYLASDAAYEDEMLPALSCETTRQATIIPILLRPCDLTGQPVENRTTPNPYWSAGKYHAVTEYPSLDLPLTKIGDEIRNKVYELRGEPLPKR
jgi:predicted MPP superfamily phosphohydrolase